MSLFENNEYRWRETYFVILHERDRPSLDAVAAALAELGSRYELTAARGDDSGRFESATVVSPSDFSAMDISYLAGDEVRSHLDQLVEDLRKSDLTREDRAKVDRLTGCDARFEVYHFERVADDEMEEQGFLDPGALLNVLDKLAGVCNGICIDPQSGAVV